MKLMRYVALTSKLNSSHQILILFFFILTISLYIIKTYFIILYYYLCQDSLEAKRLAADQLHGSSNLSLGFRLTYFYVNLLSMGLWCNLASSGTPVVFEEIRVVWWSVYIGYVMTNWSTEAREILGSGFKSLWPHFYLIFYYFYKLFLLRFFQFLQFFQFILGKFFNFFQFLLVISNLF